MLELQQYLAVERSMVLVPALTKAVRKHVKDTEVLGWITYEFDHILNANHQRQDEFDQHDRDILPAASAFK